MITVTLQDVLDPDNVEKAMDHLKEKKNTCGADGVFLRDLDEYWEDNRDTIIQSLREHSFAPGIVKQVEIIQGNGKRRGIVIMNSIDRLLLRCLQQKLQEETVGFFHENSFAYQPNRGVNDAIRKIVSYVSEKREWVAEIDIHDFFNTINHEKLKVMIDRFIVDEELKLIISKYLSVRVENDFRLTQMKEGLLLGNPISPWLSNLYLHDLDTDLGEKGFSFVRFSDNIYILTKSYEDGLNKLAYVRKKLEKDFLLDINSQKTGIYRVYNRRILGKELSRSEENGRIYAHKPQRKRSQVFSRWHRSAIQQVNHHQIADEIHRSMLDIRFSFLHSANNRRESLNLDIAEILKPVIVDRVIFTCINRRELDAAAHFEVNPENGGIYLNKVGKEIFIGNLEHKLYQRIRVKNENITYDALIKREVKKLQKHIETGEKYWAYKYY